MRMRQYAQCHVEIDFLGFQIRGSGIGALLALQRDTFFHITRLRPVQPACQQYPEGIYFIILVLVLHVHPLIQLMTLPRVELLELIYIKQLLLALPRAALRSVALVTYGCAFRLRLPLCLPLCLQFRAQVFR
jgi:hypothetical protein